MKIKNRYEDNAKLVKINKKDLWSLDATIIVMLRDLLNAFNKHKQGYPCNMTEEEWTDKITSISNCFDYALKCPYSLLTKEENEVLDKDTSPVCDKNYKYIERSEEVLKVYDRIYEIKKLQQSSTEKGLKELCDNIHNLWT